MRIRGLSEKKKTPQIILWWYKFDCTDFYDIWTLWNSATEIGWSTTKKMYSIEHFDISALLVVF